MPGRKRAATVHAETESSEKRARTEPTRRSQRNQNKSAGGTSGANTNNAISKATAKAQSNVRDVKPEKTTPELTNQDKIEESTSRRKKTSNGAIKKAKPAIADLIPRPAYWLMKAEPESRIEKGKDVKFSIDDLATTDKEPWDGVRNLVARNNMRAMNKGELAFFYHSNCKIPGIAGVMKIEAEHSIDESAFDPEHPYYDEKSIRETPKWSLVNVKFLKKLENLIPLKELQKYSRPGCELDGMQVLRMTRLSVSRVSQKEWEFICRELAKLDPTTLESIE